MGQELAAAPVALHVTLPATGPGDGQLGLHLGQRRLHGLAVEPVGLRGGVDGRGQDGHGVGVPGAGGAPAVLLEVVVACAVPSVIG